MRKPPSFGGLREVIYFGSGKNHGLQSVMESERLCELIRTSRFQFSFTRERNDFAGFRVGARFELANALRGLLGNISKATSQQ